MTGWIEIKINAGVLGTACTALIDLNEVTGFGIIIKEGYGTAPETKVVWIEVRNGRSPYEFGGEAAADIYSYLYRQLNSGVVKARFEG